MLSRLQSAPRRVGRLCRLRPSHSRNLGVRMPLSRDICLAAARSACRLCGLPLALWASLHHVCLLLKILRA